MILYERCEWIMNGGSSSGHIQLAWGNSFFFIGIIRMDAMKVFCF